MPVEVIMPKVDMDMAHGTVAEWHKAEGDRVEAGEPLFDIETDKATMEVDAPASGILRQISAESGQQIDIGTCIAQIYAIGEELVPSEFISDTGAAEQDFQTETSVAAGVADADDDQRSLAGGNTDVNNDSSSAMVAANASAVDELAKNTEALSTKQTAPATDIRATPYARRLALQNDIDLSLVQGSGPKGRITRQDIEQRLQQIETPSDSLVSNTCAVSTAELDSLGIAYSVAPVSRMRDTIARRLSESKSSVPHFYLEQDLLVDKLLDYRADLNNALAERGGTRVSVNHLVVQACARALQAVPETNVAWGGNQVVRFQHAAVAVAVSMEEGLLTPVIKDVDAKSIEDVAEELVDLTERARAGRLTNSELRGASMSVSNLGMFEVQRFKAIINPPQSMILAVGGSTPRPVITEDGQVARAEVMSVCLSCDHRVIDGAVAARWMQAFRRCIEQPVRLLI